MLNMDTGFAGFGDFPGPEVMAAPLTAQLGPRQKAAIIVRLILGDGEELDLSTLPPEMQARLAQDMASMDLIDRRTRDAVISEFCDKLEEIGVSFPGTLDGALDILGQHLSVDTTNRLRRMAVLSGGADPWARIGALSVEQLSMLAESEAEEIAAVMFSRLPVARAAEVLGKIDAARARRIAYSMSLIGKIDAEGLRRIGMALMRAADALPIPALTERPDEKVGAILNHSTAQTRDQVLEGLDQDDAVFAGEVRRSIFTFASIPARVEGRDIPRILRGLEPGAIVKAMAGATGDAVKTVEFMLGSMSSRMAESLREEMAEAGKVSAKDAEEAMTAVVAEIRRLEGDGELFLIALEDE